jgi:hypothetical protein
VKIQRNGQPEPTAEREVRGGIERSVRATGVVAPYDGKVAADGEIGSEFNNVSYLDSPIHGTSRLQKVPVGLQSDDDVVRVNTRSSRMQHVLHIGALARCNTAVDVSSPDSEPNYICCSPPARLLIASVPSVSTSVIPRQFGFILRRRSRLRRFVILPSDGSGGALIRIGCAARWGADRFIDRLSRLLISIFTPWSWASDILAGRTFTVSHKVTSELSLSYETTLFGRSQWRHFPIRCRRSPPLNGTGALWGVLHCGSGAIQSRTGTFETTPRIDYGLDLGDCGQTQRPGRAREGI